MSRKQYEQIQNALNQMSSLERQEKMNSSIDEKSFDTTMGSKTSQPKPYPQI